MTTPRAIHISFGKHNELPDTYTLAVECDDERTDSIMIVPTGSIDPFGLVGLSPEALSVRLSGETGRAAVLDHVERCVSCQKETTK